jgi:alkylation response protein AidB-like acyl-CoA dehydrogenase
MHSAEDTQALRDMLDRRLAQVGPGDAWAALVAAGVTGLVVPEALGGAGLSVADAAPVLDALGFHGIATPFLETAVIAPILLTGQQTPAADEVLRAIASGERVAVAGLDPRLRPSVSATPTGSGWRLDGDALLVLDVNEAGHILVAARTEGYAPALLLAAPGADGLTMRRYPTIDRRSAADLRFINVDAVLLGTDMDEVLTAAGDVALACLSVEAAALMRRLVADTVAYTKEREQFGQPIARFQALQHRMVDMHIQARRTAATAARAVAALDGHWAERARLASAAKVTAAEAGRFVGQNAVQLHGGMGMTEELPIARLFRRLTVIEHELGSADQHRQRYARMAAQLAA